MTTEIKTRDMILTSTFTKIMDAWLTGKRRIFLDGGTASSKCLGKGTRIVMSDLTLKNVEDISVGDILMGIDGKPRKVLSLYRGQDNLYKIKQARGIDYIVSSNHILSLRENWKEIRRCEPSHTGKSRQRRIYVRNDHSYDIVNIPLHEYMDKSGKWKRRHKGWKLQGVELPEQEVNIEPYFVGLWLGDGTLRNTNVTNSDVEIIDYLKWFAVRNDLIYHKIKHDKYGHTLVRNSTTSKNPLREELISYGIFENKRIPKEYMNNSRQIRLELLAGLIDSDGYKPKTRQNTLVITQINKKLSEDILLLVRSLGFYATMNQYTAKMKRKDGTVYEVETYRVEFVGDTIGDIPLKLERKRVNNRVLPRRYASSIEVESAGYGNYYGFELDGDHLFLLEDFTVTHNTFSTIQFFKLLLENYKEPIIATVTSESMPHLKRGAIRDFQAIMGDDFGDKFWNRSDFIYTFPKSGCKLEFISSDQPAKLRGGRRDIIFFNELNNIARDSFREADMRTRLFTIADWNPTAEFWFHDERWFDDPVNVYVSGLTYRDTPEAVTESTIANIEAYKERDPNWYRVYGLGLTGKLEGLVYPKFEQIEKLPEGKYFYGLDYGFASDPTTLVKNVIIGDNLYSQEIFYDASGLTNDDISRKMTLCGVERDALIYPDPNEPKSAEELRRLGWRIGETVRGSGSVEFGTQRVNQFNQFWTNDSLNCIKEQRNFRYIEDKEQSGRFTDKTTHEWSHAMAARRYAVASYKGDSYGKLPTSHSERTTGGSGLERVRPLSFKTSFSRR
jgi:PBSX family phage terminase large subunit